MMLVMVFTVTAYICNIASASNVNRSGVWAFRLDIEKDDQEEEPMT